MVSVIRSHVHFAAKDDSGALLKPEELTTGEAAVLAQCTTENIRQWIKKHRDRRCQQRPDVRAAEEQLHTASANVGVARVRDRCSHPPMSRPPDGETNVTPKPIATRIQLASA
jgi:hypothetical protein